MTPQEFCRWLRGVFEVTDPKVLNRTQTECIKKHLALVFTNVTAKDGIDFSKLFRDLDKAQPSDPNWRVFC